MAFFSPSTLRGRVFLLVATLVAITGLVASVLLLQLQDARDALTRVHDDRVVPLVLLKNVSDAYAITIVDTAHKAADGRVPLDQAARTVRASEEKIARAWQGYLATTMSPQERELALEAQVLMKGTDTAIARLAGFLEADDSSAVRRFREQELYPAFDPLTGVLDRLAVEQRDRTEGEVVRSSEQLKRALLVSAALLGASLVVGLLLGRRIGRSIVRGVDRAVQVAEAVAAGADVPASEGRIEANELARLQVSLTTMRRRLDDAMDQVKELARRDPLTGLLNRRALDEAMARMLAQGRRHSHENCLMFVDLDHFKRINDRFGHAAGDEVLRHVSKVMLETVREIDLVARFGGEEFIVLLPDTDLERAAAVAERLRRALSEPPPATLPRELRLSASIGLTRLVTEDDADAALRRADRALYEAKNAGRNRVVVH
jgi:diguanylate cyclase (GGDEF)-like protein